MGLLFFTAQEFYALDMGFVPELFGLNHPTILQYLALTNIYAPCVRDDCEADDNTGLNLLPAFFLWPIQFNRYELMYVCISFFEPLWEQCL